MRESFITTKERENVDLQSAAIFSLLQLYVLTFERGSWNLYLFE